MFVRVCASIYSLPNVNKMQIKCIHLHTNTNTHTFGGHMLFYSCLSITHFSVHLSRFSHPALFHCCSNIFVSSFGICVFFRLYSIRMPLVHVCDENVCKHMREPAHASISVCAFSFRRNLCFFVQFIDIEHDMCLCIYLSTM